MVVAVVVVRVGVVVVVVVVGVVVVMVVIVVAVVVVVVVVVVVFKLLSLKGTEDCPRTAVIPARHVLRYWWRSRGVVIPYKS